jgi:hypothetical protein
MIIIEIIKGSDQPISKSFKNKPDELSWSQKAFAHLGGVFPVEIKVPIKNPTHVHPVGKYSLHPSSFKVGQYGDLEINRWEINLNPITASSSN